jgi:hypothetical protein
MTKKRRNNGRSKHGRGMTASVLCNGCGCKPKKDKAVKRFIVKNMVDTSSLRDIREACIVENYQTPTGVNVPEVLQPFMGGIKFLPFNEAATKRFFKTREDEKAREDAKNKSKAGKKEAPKKVEEKVEESKE